MIFHVTFRQLGAANASQSKSMEKLSSGLRINRAGDDAAGLAISEKMRAQVRGLDQAQRNSQDAISMIQTAEGALNETHSILQRMRELATQAANDTNTGTDREAIQEEINQLSSEINCIGNTTEFNTRKILNGDVAITGDGRAIKSGSTTLGAGVTAVSVDSRATAATGVYDVNVTSNTVAKIESDVLTGVASQTVTAGATVDLIGGAYKVAITSEDRKEIDSSSNTNSMLKTSGGNQAITIEANSSLADGTHTLKVEKHQISSDNVNGSIALDVSGTKLDGYESGSYTVTTSRTFDNTKVSDGSAGTNGGNLSSVISNFEVADSATAAQAAALNGGFNLTVSIADDGTDSGVAEISFTNSDTGNVVTYTTSSASNGAQTLQLDGMKFEVDVDNLLNGVTGLGAAATIGVAASDYNNASLTIATNAVNDVITVSDGTNTGTATALADNTAGQAMSVTVGGETLDFTIDQSTFKSGETLSTTIQSQYTISLEDASSNQIGVDTVVNELELTDPTKVTNVSFGGSGLLVDFDVAGLQALSSQAAAYTETITVDTDTGYTAELQKADGTSVDGIKQSLSAAAVSGTKIDLGGGRGVELTYDGGALAENSVYFGVNANVTEYTFELTDNGGTKTYDTQTVSAGDTVEFSNGISLTTDAATLANSSNMTFEIENTEEDDSLTMQIGANAGQTFSIDISDMRSKALKITGGTSAGTITASDGKVATFTTDETVTDGTNSNKSEFALDISTADKATAAISVINDAINAVSAQRSKLGAFQNRLEHTINNLGTSAENLTAAESRIRDVDMAREMMEQTKQSILAQASQAMLAQANQAPQGVLQLLR